MRARQLIEAVLHGRVPARLIEQEFGPAMNPMDPAGFPKIGVEEEDQDQVCLQALADYIGRGMGAADPADIGFDASRPGLLTLRLYTRIQSVSDRRLQQDLPSLGLRGLAGWLQQMGVRQEPLPVGKVLR